MLVKGNFLLALLVNLSLDRCVAQPATVKLILPCSAVVERQHSVHQDLVEIEHSALQIDEDWLTELTLLIHSNLAFPDDVNLVNRMTAILHHLACVELPVGDAHDEIVDKLLLAAIQYRVQLTDLLREKNVHDMSFVLLLALDPESILLNDHVEVVLD